MFCRDEFEQIGMRAIENAHLRAAPRARAFDRAARCVEHVHVAAWTRCRRSRRMHTRAARTDRRKVIPDAAAATHRLGCLQQRDVNTRQAVAVDVLYRIAYG